MVPNIFSLVEEDKADKCKGLFWRATESQYLSSHKSIESRKSLRLLKSMGCPGCRFCDWMWEYITEDLSCCTDTISHIQHGKLYQFQLNGHHDSESGYYEVDGSEFVEVIA